MVSLVMLKALIGPPCPMRDEAVAGTRVRTHVASVHIVGAAARVSQTPGKWTVVGTLRRRADGRSGMNRRRSIPTRCRQPLKMTSPAERALWMGERRLQTILDSAHVAFVAVDAEGLIVNWNNEARASLGWSRADALGRAFAEIAFNEKARAAYEDEVAQLSPPTNGGPMLRTCRLDLSHREGRQIPAELTLSRVAAGDSHLVQIFVRDLSDNEQAARDRRRAEERLAYERLHDVLTGLPNRTLLLDRLGHALALAGRQKNTLAVLTADLDNFKLVNESLGHAIGDQVLLEVVARLRQIVRVSDTMARTRDDALGRLDGDEFVVTERIVEALSKPFSVAAEPIFLTTSVGIALSRPGASPESLIRDATV